MPARTGPQRDAETTRLTLSPGVQAFRLGPDVFLLSDGSRMVHVTGPGAAARIDRLLRGTNEPDVGPNIARADHSTLAPLIEAGLVQTAMATTPGRQIREWVPPRGGSV